MGAIVSPRASKKDNAEVPMTTRSQVHTSSVAARSTASANTSAPRAAELAGMGPDGGRWQIVSPSLLLSKDKTAIQAKHCGRKGGAVAGPVMTEGTHTFTMVIERGDAGDFVGSGVYLGVADATGGVTEDAGGFAWGYYPKSGRITGLTNAMAGHWQTEIYTHFNSAKSCKTANEINGATVSFTVDMDEHCLYVAVNGERPVEAGVKLPASVRPWAQLEHSPDKIRIRGYHAVHTRVVQILGSRSSPDVIRVTCLGVAGEELQVLDVLPSDSLAQFYQKLSETLQKDGLQLKLVLPDGRLLPNLPDGSCTETTIAEALGFMGSSAQEALDS